MPALYRDSFEALGELYPNTEWFLVFGLHRFTLQNGLQLTGISAPTWDDFESYLRQLTPEDRVVISPELMTCAGINPEDVFENQLLIEDRTSRLLDFSTNFPDTLFILGTPTFSFSKPRNTALIIRNGEILAQTNKRSGATLEERESFDLLPEEPCFLIPGMDIGLLICADLATLAFMSAAERTGNKVDRMFEITQREQLIGKKLNLLASGTKAILVISCWGIGGNRWMLDERKNPNLHYAIGLISACNYVLGQHEEVEEIVIIDRPPSGIAPDDELYRYVSNKPLTLHFRRK